MYCSSATCRYTIPFYKTVSCSGFAVESHSFETIPSYRYSCTPRGGPAARARAQTSLLRQSAAVQAHAARARSRSVPDHDGRLRLITSHRQRPLAKLKWGLAAYICVLDNRLMPRAVGLLLVALLAPLQQVLGWDNGLALTPPKVRLFPIFRAAPLPHPARPPPNIGGYCVAVLGLTIQFVCGRGSRRGTSGLSHPASTARALPPPARRSAGS